MGLNREDKATVIAEISEVVSNSSAMVIAEYRGLTVQAVTKLRAEARKNGVTVRCCTRYVGSPRCGRHGVCRTC